MSSGCGSCADARRRAFNSRSNSSSGIDRPPNVPALSSGRQRERSDRQARLLQRLVGQSDATGCHRRGLLRRRRRAARDVALRPVTARSDAAEVVASQGRRRAQLGTVCIVRLECREFAPYKECRRGDWRGRHRERRCQRRSGQSGGEGQLAERACERQALRKRFRPGCGHSEVSRRRRAGSDPGDPGRSS